MKSARIAIGGNLEVTFTVEPNQKYAALPVTDRPGVRFLVQVIRVRRR